LTNAVMNSTRISRMRDIIRYGYMRNAPGTRLRLRRCRAPRRRRRPSDSRSTRKKCRMYWGAPDSVVLRQTLLEEAERRNDDGPFNLPPGGLSSVRTNR
jgi:hypothetical protein